MQIRADFSLPEILGPGEPEFVASPVAGVERRMLDRVGGEIARATSVVRYARNSRFPTHHHEAGEEYLVLAGVFSDEDGAAPAGFYVRNPPGSSHAPFSGQGCEIFVKLRQFAADDLTPVRLDTRDPALYQRDPSTGCARAVLHRFGSEQVFMDIRDNGSEGVLADAGGVEMLVVSGEIACAGRRLGPGAWARFPPGAEMRFRAERDSVIWVKTGHLSA